MIIPIYYDASHASTGGITRVSYDPPALGRFAPQAPPAKPACMLETCGPGWDVSTKHGVTIVIFCGDLFEANVLLGHASRGCHFVRIGSGKDPLAVPPKPRVIKLKQPSMF